MKDISRIKKHVCFALDLYVWAFILIKIMNVGIAQGERNPNSSWLNSRGVWLTYIILVFVLHFILLSIPYISTPVAWTLTTTIHNIVCIDIFVSGNKYLFYLF
jgi:hypothetical protein